MKPKKQIAAGIDSLIIEMRGQKVILDADLARIYGAQTFRLNEAIKRNHERFPEDFLFQLTAEEWNSLTSQIAMSKGGRGGRRTLPYAFMATVLNSPRAVQMSLFVVRAFVKMRGILSDTRELARKLAAIEQELKGRLDIHEAAIVDVLQRIMRILEPPPEAAAPPEPPKPEIGFHMREEPPRYRIRRRQAAS